MARTFTAQFDSDCWHCGGPICEGDDIAYVDNEIACEDCVAETEDD
ncbi:hypothetical protein [Streptomyces sp. 1222.5]